MMNIAVLASGNGSNFQAIVEAAHDKKIKSKIKILVVDVETAFARQRARKYGIRDIFINPAGCKDREEFDKKIIEVLEEENIDLIVLAGFMRILCSFFVAKYKDRILNIHPALLPSFKGDAAIKDAYEYGVKVTGVTVHFVDEKVDSGPIILQQAVTVSSDDDIKSLEEKIHKVEHKLYLKAIQLIEEGRISVQARRVIIKS